MVEGAISLPRDQFSQVKFNLTSNLAVFASFSFSLICNHSSLLP